ncbi:hypothetical protein [Acholeplasma granularum]|uniref:hypothetical protein n=1 Tax=Acholeplasma granularum TaxID=264635 RepID=UPI00047211B7|nr:hypothetical protein [Acholeplasma granularum]
MNKLHRLGDILYTFDTNELFSHYKLSGTSALQFLIFDIGFITNTLYFDLDSDAPIEAINEYRRSVNKELPLLLQKKNFTLDTKKTELKGYLDTYAFIDNHTKEHFYIKFDYLNRVHILKPEYFARKDKDFEDLHIYSLSTLENYARYFVEYNEGMSDETILNYLMINKKILPQQYPFLKKITMFYLGMSTSKSNLERIYTNTYLKDILNFNDDELKYLRQIEENIFEPHLILPQTMANKVIKHPKIKFLMREK